MLTVAMRTARAPEARKRDVLDEQLRADKRTQELSTGALVARRLCMETRTGSE
jgi:hypothetical protein